MNYFALLKTTYQEWTRDRVPILASSLAFYTSFSLAPLLLVLVGLTGIFYGDAVARSQLVAQMSRELGPDIAQFLQDVLKNADNPEQGIVSSIVGVVTLIIGATSVFVQLQNALNQVWNIRVSGGFRHMLMKRLMSFGVVMTLGFLLLVSLVVTSLVSSIDSYLVERLPGGHYLVVLITWSIAFVISAMLFAIMFKYMPDATIAWRDVIVGALVTALLFNVGRLVLGLYLGNVGMATSYGAAGSFVVILLWVYYSTQIVMFGAEFTQVWARARGRRIEAEAGAEIVLDAERHDSGTETVRPT